MNDAMEGPLPEGAGNVEAGPAGPLPEGAGNLEPGPAGEPFVQEDPTVSLEVAWRRSQVEQARKDIVGVAGAINDENAARLLRIIETYAEHHRQLLATLGLADEPKAKRAKNTGLDPLALYESSLGGAIGGTDEETFGAQAAQGIISSFSSALGGGEGKKIQQLMSALRDAKEGHLDDMVPLLEAKLKAILSQGDSQVAGTQGEPAAAPALPAPAAPVVATTPVVAADYSADEGDTAEGEAP